MGRRKIEMKKIISSKVRHGTFSKRKKGIFKKAHDIHILCDAEISVIIFSSFGKLYEFSSSSVDHTIERREENRVERIEPPMMDMLTLQLKSTMNPTVCKEVIEKTNEIRHMKGKDLQELETNDLDRLEDAILNGLRKVKKWKCNKVMQENKHLKELLTSTYDA